MSFIFVWFLHINSIRIKNSFFKYIPNNRKRVRYEEPQGALDMASTAMRSKGIAVAMVSIAIASIVRYIVP